MPRLDALVAEKRRAINSQPRTTKRPPSTPSHDVLERQTDLNRFINDFLTAVGNSAFHRAITADRGNAAYYFCVLRGPMEGHNFMDGWRPCAQFVYQWTPYLISIEQHEPEKIWSIIVLGEGPLQIFYAYSDRLAEKLLEVLVSQPIPRQARQQPMRMDVIQRLRKRIQQEMGDFQPGAPYWKWTRTAWIPCKTSGSMISFNTGWETHYLDGNQERVLTEEPPAQDNVVEGLLEVQVIGEVDPETVEIAYWAGRDERVRVQVPRQMLSLD